uniref:Uncharacterized protein n=1 Tax=Nelumbo nucifera TaxID=4432 RepID=A0A822YEZ4_NELNU|nr:TPA_asm: hypothetical protein HUJ06_009928 [Nelumbo nucifera]
MLFRDIPSGFVSCGSAFVIVCLKMEGFQQKRSFGKGKPYHGCAATLRNIFDQKSDINLVLTERVLNEDLLPAVVVITSSGDEDEDDLDFLHWGRIVLVRPRIFNFWI